MNNLKMILNTMETMNTIQMITNNHIKQEKSSYVHRDSDGAEYRKPSAGDPIRNQEDLKKIYTYFEQGLSSTSEVLNLRNYCIFMLGITTGLRISDLLKIKFRDVIDILKLNKFSKSKRNFKSNYIVDETFCDIFQDRLLTCEQKTGKMNRPIISTRIKKLLYKYITLLINNNIDFELSDYLWVSSPYGMNKISIKNKPLANKNYYDVITKISKEITFTENYHLSTHSMRKTFGYWLFKNSTNQLETLAILQELFNHSNQRVTLRYIGITEENKRESFDNLNNILDSIFE